MSHWRGSGLHKQNNEFTKVRNRMSLLSHQKITSRVTIHDDPH